MELTAETAFEQMAFSGRHLLDVRAEVEFTRSAFPQCVNVPILNSEEREKVGTCYVTQGADQAMALGHEIVSGRKRAERTAAWASLAESGQIFAVTCARGGSRSQIAAEWLRAEGLHVPRVSGGYKALRSHALATIDRFVSEQRFIIIAGRTGSGKTRLLRNAQVNERAVDLELIARHSGSSFGAIHGAQPAQATFENELAFACALQMRACPGVVYLEDEGANIGVVRLPAAFYQKMSHSPRVVIEASLEDRAQNILQEYIIAPLAGPSAFGDALARLEASLLASVSKISRRLGGERTKRYLELIRGAAEEHRSSGDPSQHEVWIRMLLTEYYDPAYDFDLQRKASQIIGRMSCAEAEALLQGSTLAPLRSKDETAPQIAR